MSAYTGKPHWTDYKTKLKMSTMDRVLREIHAEHRTTERGTINEVHLMLAQQFGHIGTTAKLRVAICKAKGGDVAAQSRAAEGGCPMNAKLNKRERRARALLEHFATCERVALYCGRAAAQVDGKRISVALWKAERDAYKAAERYCNGEISEARWLYDVGQAEQFVRNVLGKLPPGFFVNDDARGYALKIDHHDPQGRELIDTVRLQTDWGGFGILSPDITGDRKLALAIVT